MHTGAITTGKNERPVTKRQLSPRKEKINRTNKLSKVEPSLMNTFEGKFFINLNRVTKWSFQSFIPRFVVP